MPDQLQLRGGTTTEHNSFTGALREVTVDTTKKTLVVHDGSQAGGTALMKESGAIAASSVQIGTGGVERFKITSSEVVFNETSTDTDFRIEGNGDANLFKIDAGNDRIGLGIATPQRILHQHVSTSDGNGHQFTNSTTGSGSTDGLVVGIVAAEDAVFWNHEDTDIKIATNNIERIRIKNDALVGVNVDDPLELVHMKGNLFITLNGSTANEGNGIKFQTKTGGFTTSYGAAIFGKRVNDTSSYLRFDTGGQSEKMRLDENGRLGIGTTNPDTLLHLAADGAVIRFENTDTTISANQVFGAIEFESRDTSTNSTGVVAKIDTIASGTFDGGSLVGGELRFFTSKTNAINPTERMRIDAFGNIGIGTQAADPDVTLHVSGTNNTGLTKVFRLTNSGGSPNTTVSMEFECGVDEIATISANNAGGDIGSLMFGTASSQGAYPTEKMRINSSGNVGIGTSAPTKVLHVTGTSSPEILLRPSDASPALFIGDSNRSGDSQHLAEFGARWNGTKVARMVMQAGDDTTNKDNGQIVFMTSATGTTSERLRINESGDVGINESAPSARLHVNGGGGLFVERSAGTSVAGFKQSGGSSMNIYFQNSGSTNHPSIGSNNQDMTLGTNNNERMRILSDGKVGIGTTAPVNDLDIVSATDTYIAIKSSTASTGNTATLGFAPANAIIGTQLISEAQSDFSSGADRDASFAIQNRYNGTFYTNLSISETGTQDNLSFSNAGDHFKFRNTTTSNTGTLLFVESSRNTTNASYKLAQWGSTSAARFIVLDSGNVQNTSNSYGAISDQTLKENIVDASSQWSDIKNIKVRKFNFIETTDPDKKTMLGIVAQEAETVCPNLVETTLTRQNGEEKEFKTFKYSVLYMKAIKCLQEAMAKIEVLETKVAALEAV